jgi:hypothetical protein
MAKASGFKLRLPGYVHALYIQTSKNVNGKLYKLTYKDHGSFKFEIYHQKAFPSLRTAGEQNMGNRRQHEDSCLLGCNAV